MNNAPTHLIEAHALSQWPTGGRIAVDGFDLSVSEGEICAVVGEAGAGKTAILEMLIGVARPSRGRALVLGIDTAVNPIGARRHLTYVSQQAALCEPLTLLGNVAFFAAVGSPGPQRTTVDCENAMRTVGIAERDLRAPIAGLPRHRVIAAWLAVALLRDTPVVILDDPSRGVSGQDSQQLIESLGELRRRGKTVLMATGDALFAGQLANRIVILKAGRKIAERRGSEVFGMSVAKLYLDYAGRVPTRVPS